MKRRRFLADLVSTVALGPALSCEHRTNPTASDDPSVRAERVTDSCAIAHRTAKHARTLSRLEWQTVDAVCARLIPRDQEPGAREIGVVNYIDDQLTRPPVSSFLDLIQQGSADLNRWSKRTGNLLFAELSDAAQDGLLEQVAAGRRVGSYSGSRFLRVLLSLTLEGCFGDPIYGGNRDQAGWRLIAFRPQTPGPKCPY